MKRSLKRACVRHLRDTFGLNDFRPGQKAAAHALLSGRDVLCILPTGAGKSLCWQLPAVVRDGMTVVVSPLIALMQDQVHHLTTTGVPAVTLNSLMSKEERARALHSLGAGETRIVFVAPERLTDPAFLRLCQRMQPWLLVVDEAHCAVQWGQEFRPAYGKIRDFVRMLERRPVLCAMTATADRDMQRDILSMLGMRRVKRVTLPILRENLVYEARTTLDPTGDILRLCRENAGSTVVFCRTRQRTEDLAALLRRQGIPADHYHAGLDRTQRENVQRRFREGDVSVLTATTAFGMGVDIPQIRRVIHDSLPESLIDYVQQSGRAGRDGAPASCILLLSPNDVLRKGGKLHHQWKRLRWRPLRRRRFLQEEWLPLRQLLSALLTADCIPAAIARSFGARAGRCGHCTACASGPLHRTVPDLPRLTQAQTVAYFIRWQRDAIARARGVSPEKVLTERGVAEAARRLLLPENAGEASGDLSRLLEHFRRLRTHQNGPDRIS